MAIMSRRNAIVGAALAASSAAPAFAQTNSSSAQSATPASLREAEDTMQDPTRIYPKPPFERQSQPWPGLAKNMNPRPDHGETVVQGLGAYARAQGADHRRRFRHGARRGDRLCARRRRRRDQLFSDRGAGRRGGGETDPRRGAQGGRAARRHARRGILQEAGRRSGRGARRPRHRSSATRAGSSRGPRSSTCPQRISTRR